MRFGRFLGKVNTLILLSITYAVVLGIIAVIARLFGAAQLDKKLDGTSSYWKIKPETDSSLDRHKLQF